MRYTLLLILAVILFSIPRAYSQKGWYFTISGGPSWYETFSYKGLPHPHFYIYKTPGYTKGLHLDYHFNNNFSLYTGLNWATVRVGIGFYPLIYRTNAGIQGYLEGSSNTQNSPWQFDIGGRHHLQLAKGLFSRFTLGMTYVGLVATTNSQHVTEVHLGGIDPQHIKYHYRSIQLVRSNFMLKFAFGLEYRFKNRSKLGLEVVHGEAFRDIYQLQFLHFEFNGVEYDPFDITTKGSYTSLDVSYSFYLSHKKKRA